MTSLILAVIVTLFINRASEALSLEKRGYCDRGYYKPDKTCLPCPPGYYCPEGSKAAIVCPRGYYCPLLAFVPNGCPVGTFNGNFGTAQCFPCTLGSYCDSLSQTSPTGHCSAGYYCLSGSKTPTPNGVAGNICPPGHYCPAGTGSPIACPAGTYNNYTGITAIYECTMCVPGMYCGSQGIIAPSGLCDAGYYCTNGSVTNNPTDGVTGDICPPEHYCPQGTAVPIPCPVGTHNITFGLSAVEQCHPILITSAATS